MRPTFLVLLFSVALTAQASWFGSDSNAAEPSQWTAEQLSKAQTVLSSLKESAFDSWDDSRLRDFLVEQGVVNPSGPREQLVLLAKQKWRQYASAASSAASSAANAASATVSTALYGDTAHQASKAASSIVAQATSDISRKLDDSKDYVYSTWDNNRLRSYLEEKGVLKKKQETTREQMLAKMKDAYAKVANPIWQAWSDSYIREWLASHGIVRPKAQRTRDELAADMKKYYYEVHDTVYSTWSDSQMRDWLVEHRVIKSDAPISREKLQKLLADQYANAKDTFWAAWRDQDMHDWLVEHGYLKSDAQKTRDQLIALMNEKYHDYSARIAPYLVWPDARLRAYLREHGLPESALPTSRPGLLQEVRIRWVQGAKGAEALYQKIKDVISSGVGAAEEKLGMILDLLTGQAESAKARTRETFEEGKGYVNEKLGHVEEKAREAKERAQEKVKEAKGHAEQSKEQVEKKWNEKMEQAKKVADQAKVEL